MNRHLESPVAQALRSGFVRCCRRSLLSLAVAGCFSGMAFALPNGASVVNGTVLIDQLGNTLTVTNSNRAIINWQSFSIAGNETVRFVQPSSTSSVLNRVVTADPSVLLGSLQSNGRVYLINPAGLLVGAGARIDVAGFVGSTLSLSNDDFLAGRLNFSGAPDAGSVKVENGAEIRSVSGGHVYLVAPQVENSGLVSTPQGEVILAAGNTVELIDSGTPGVRVAVTAGGEALNVGQLVAESGRIGMVGAVVRQQGTANASSLVSEGGRIFLKATQKAELTSGSTTSASGTQGGKVEADGGELALVGGKVDVTGSTGSGGRVELLGDKVGVLDGAQVDASGETGGGTILVGGDYQGKNPGVRNAQISYLGKGASLVANARSVGNGGKVIVWADDTTRAYGTIAARGGARGGDGGFVETSGKKSLDFRAQVDTSAPHGAAGNLLLDPFAVTIYAGPATDIGGSTWTESSGSTNLEWSYIDTQLGLNNVTITTTDSGGAGDNITFSNAYGPMTASGSSTYKLILNANDKVVFSQDLTLQGALQANAGSDIDFNANVTSAESVFARTTGGNINQNTSMYIQAPSLTARADTGNVQLTGKNKVEYVDLVSTSGAITYKTDYTGTTYVTADATTGSIAITGDTNSAEIAIDTITTTGGAVSVEAQKAILDDNGSGTANISTGSANITLRSYNGTANSGELAISSDVDTTGTVDTCSGWSGSACSSTHSYGSIGLRDVGTSQAGSVYLNAGSATSEGELSYYRYGDLSLANIAMTPGVGSTEPVSIGASGDITVPAGGFLFGTGSSSAVISAGGDFTLNSGSVTMRANDNTIIAGGQLRINSGKTLTADPNRPLDVYAGSVYLNGGTLKADNADLMLVTPGDVDIVGGGLLQSVGQTLTFLADNLNVYQGSVSAKTIDGTLFGNLVLGTGSSTGYMNATNGIVDLAIGGTGVQMYNGSYINSTDVTQPEGGLIKLFFSGLSEGGSYVDDLLSFDNAYKVGGSFTTLGSGLQVSYGLLSNPVANAINSATQSSADSANGTSEEDSSLTLTINTGDTGIDTLTDGTPTTGTSGESFDNLDQDNAGAATTGTRNSKGKTNAKRRVQQCTAAG